MHTRLAEAAGAVFRNLNVPKMYVDRAIVDTRDHVAGETAAPGAKRHSVQSEWRKWKITPRLQAEISRRIQKSINKVCSSHLSDTWSMRRDRGEVFKAQASDLGPSRFGADTARLD